VRNPTSISENGTGRAAPCEERQRDGGQKKFLSHGAKPKRSNAGSKTQSSSEGKNGKLCYLLLETGGRMS